MRAIPRPRRSDTHAAHHPAIRQTDGAQRASRHHATTAETRSWSSFGERHRFPFIVDTVLLSVARSAGGTQHPLSRHRLAVK